MRKNLCQGLSALCGTLKMLHGFQLFKKRVFSQNVLGLGLICLFLFFSKYMSAVNLAAFNIISHYQLMRILLLKLLALPFSCNSRTFSVPHSFCYNIPQARGNVPVIYCCMTNYPTI